MENSMEILKKLSVELPYDLGIPLLGIFVVISVWTQDSTVFFNLFKIAV